jgi:hypothetical protein
VSQVELVTQEFEFIINKLDIQLNSSPYDYLPTFTLESLSREKGTTQPPGPGVDYYTLSWSQEERKVTYELDVKWEPWVRTWMLKKLPKNQITHRSRLLAIAGNPLKVNEIKYRIEQTNKMYDKLTKAALTERESYELFHIVATTTLKYMKFNPTWILHYIRDHESSSIGEGNKWRNTFSITLNQWREVFEKLKRTMELFLRKLKWYSKIDWYLGIRARSDELTAVQDHYGPLTMERSRIIMFHPSMSLWTLFIPQKAAWYTEVLTKAMDLLKVNGQYHFPYVIGGKIYKLAQQMMSDHTYTATDGKSWESSVGILLGPYFRIFMVYFGDTPMLPSGETFTSMFGTLASIIATRHLNGTWLVLGDDVNGFDVNREQIRKIPFLEIQDGDTNAKWILGVRFDIDIEAPRISGIKMSMDRAKAMVPLDLMVYVKHGPRLIKRKRDLRTRVAWAGLFMGMFGDRTLLHALDKIEPGEFISPGEYLENLIERQSTNIDPFAWAETQGIKDIFVS